jgi:hypothetical protein
MEVKSFGIHITNILLAIYALLASRYHAPVVKWLSL